MSSYIVAVDEPYGKVELAAASEEVAAWFSTLPNVIVSSLSQLKTVSSTMTVTGPNTRTSQETFEFYVSDAGYNDLKRLLQITTQENISETAEDNWVTVQFELHVL